MSDIERMPLAPFNARTRITEADRARVYDLIGRQLDYIVNGLGSYYPDGGRKSPETIGEDVGRLKQHVLSLKSFVDDPASILDSVTDHLDKFGYAFNKRNEEEQPKDGIQLGPDLSPWSSDQNWIDGDRYQQSLRPDVSSIELLRNPRDLSSGKTNRVRYVSGTRDQL
jgi:hypothetical protein